MWHVSASLTLSLTMKCVSDFTSLCTACQLWTAGVCINMSSSAPCLTLNTCCRKTSPCVILSAFLSTWSSHTNKRICTHMPLYMHIYMLLSQTEYDLQFMSLWLSLVLKGSPQHLYILLLPAHSLCLSVCQVLCCIPLYSKIYSGTDTNVRFRRQDPPTSTTNLTHKKILKKKIQNKISKYKKEIDLCVWDLKPLSHQN